MSFILRILLSFILIFFIEYYFLRKLYRSANNFYPSLSKKKFYRWSIFILIVINTYPIWLLIAWAYASIAQLGRPQLPDSLLFDYFVMLPFWITALSIIQSVLFLLLVDIIKLLLLPLYKKHKPKLIRREAILIGILIIFSFLYVPIRAVYDFHSVEVRNTYYSLNVPHHPLIGKKIVLIADVQADKYTNRDRLGNYIRKVNEQNPDLVLIAGDIITNTPQYIDLGAEYLGEIRSANGVFSCVGDHDHWAYREDNQKSIREIRDALDKYDVKLIDNETRMVNLNGSSVGVAFVTHTYPRKADDTLLQRLTKEIQDADLKIFLVHQPAPQLSEFAKNNGYHLFLAGHTHGGQISFLFPFKNLSPTLIETRFVEGDFYLNGMLKIVNRGLGMSLVPIRLNSTPEVTVINFN